MQSGLRKHRRVLVAVMAALVAVVPMAVAYAQGTTPLDPEALREMTGLPLSDFMDVLVNIMRWALLIVSVLAVIAFIVSGILYLTAGGDEEQMARARRAFFGAIFGVIVSLLGLIIIQAVQQILGGAPALPTT